MPPVPMVTKEVPEGASAVVVVVGQVHLAAVAPEPVAIAVAGQAVAGAGRAGGIGAAGVSAAAAVR